MPKKGYSQVDEALFREAVERGDSDEEIMKAFGLKKTMVRPYKKRFGYEFKIIDGKRGWIKTNKRNEPYVPHSIDDIPKLIALARAGKDVHFIAVDFKTDDDIVRDTALKHGIRIYGEQNAAI